MIILPRPYKVLVVSMLMLLLTACGSMSATAPVRMHDGVKPDKDIVKFSISADFDLLELDGEKFKRSPNISDGQYQLQLLPGNHRFKVIYSRMWGSDALGNFVESDAYYFDVAAVAGSEYAFKHNGPNDLLDADYYDIGDVKIWLEEQKTGQEIKAIGVRDYGNIISRYILGYDKPFTPQVTLQAAAVKTIAKTEVKQAEQKNLDSEALNKVQQKAAKQLEFWWKIANAEQRKVFDDWLISQKELRENKANDSMQQNAAEQLKFWWKLADTQQRKSFLLNVMK